MLLLLAKKAIKLALEEKTYADVKVYIVEDTLIIELDRYTRKFVHMISDISIVLASGKSTTEIVNDTMKRYKQQINSYYFK
jgi:hypothetical protein